VSETQLVPVVEPNPTPCAEDQHTRQSVAAPAAATHDRLAAPFRAQRQAVRLLIVPHAKAPGPSILAAGSPPPPGRCRARRITTAVSDLRALRPAGGPADRNTSATTRALRIPRWTRDTWINGHHRMLSCARSGSVTGPPRGHPLPSSRRPGSRWSPRVMRTSTGPSACTTALTPTAAPASLMS